MSNTTNTTTTYLIKYWEFIWMFSREFLRVKIKVRELMGKRNARSELTMPVTST
jgi:hypothetical protein